MNKGVGVMTDKNSKQDYYAVSSELTCSLELSNPTEAISLWLDSTPNDIRNASVGDLK